MQIRLIKKRQDGANRGHNKFHCLVDGLVESCQWAQGVTKEEALGKLLQIENVQKALGIEIKEEEEDQK